MNKSEFSQAEKQSVVNKISCLFKEQSVIIFAYLFGSFVRSKKFSDIDIAIYINEIETCDPLKFEFGLEEKIQSFTKLPVEVRIINRAPLSFLYQVVKEGILITDKDSARRADFEGLIFKKYLDFAYYRKQYLKEVTNASV